MLTPDCEKHKPEFVFSYEGIDYFGACAEGISYFEGDLAVNLMGALRQTHDLPNEFLPHLVKEIIVAWPDRERPAVKKSFWQQLHTYSKENNYKEVCFHCFAGHGRTGTALVAMMMVLKKKILPEALLIVRKGYCKLAVESQVQCDYLIELDEYLNGLSDWSKPGYLPSDIKPSEERKDSMLCRDFYMRQGK